MSLVNQFEVTLKDFWPGHSDRMFVTDRDHGTTTTISRRLYAELKAYALENQLRFDSVIQTLRDEIHSEPIAGNDQITTTPQFSKGCVVKLSAEGSQHFPRWAPDRRGTVATNPSKQCVAVKWDGMKTAQYLSASFLERSND
jgi:hypothetical protein